MPQEAREDHDEREGKENIVSATPTERRVHPSRCALDAFFRKETALASPPRARTLRTRVSSTRRAMPNLSATAYCDKILAGVRNSDGILLGKCFAAGFDRGVAENYARDLFRGLPEAEHDQRNASTRFPSLPLLSPTPFPHLWEFPAYRERCTTMSERLCAGSRS